MSATPSVRPLLGELPFTEKIKFLHKCLFESEVAKQRKYPPRRVITQPIVTVIEAYVIHTPTYFRSELTLLVHYALEKDMSSAFCALC